VTSYYAYRPAFAPDSGAGRPSLGLTPSLSFISQPALPASHSQHNSQAPDPHSASAAQIKPPKASKPNPEYRNYNIGAAAPSRNLLFSRNASITAVELLTFLPNSVHSGSLIYRFCSNRVKPAMINTIINTQRDLLVEWGQNKCRMAMYDAMYRAGYKEWKFKKHGQFHETRKDSWDEDDLGVEGFLTPGQVKGGETPAADIPFKLLAVDVRRMPQGDDAWILRAWWRIV
jgi:hypothetical protein